MRPALIRLLAGVLALAVAAGLFVYSGVYNVSARAGHLPPTAWLLHFAMRKSARTHATGIEVPQRMDERMVIRGATWFSIGCAACHGEPGNPNPPIVDNMTPPAPRLTPLIDEWSERELFWVVDNGIKYTGMPAWATAERPDEVWSMVAFLLELPEMDAETYRKLAWEPGPDAGSPPTLARLEADERLGSTLQQCARCHGLDGMGRGTGAFPYLAGQKETYLREALEQFATGRRKSGFMQPVAGGLLPGAMRELATWYANAAPASAAVHDVDPERAARGAEIAAAGLPQRRVAGCVHCHGPGSTAANPAFPHLAGQNEEYLVRQLELFRSAARGGGDYAPLMTEIAAGLSDADIRDVAAFYASLPAFYAAPAGNSPDPPDR